MAKAKMKIDIIESVDRYELIVKLLPTYIEKNEDDYVIVNISTFFDTVDEKWKAVINYWI